MRKYDLLSLKFAPTYAEAKIWWKYLDGRVVKEYAKGYDKHPRINIIFNQHHRNARYHYLH